MNEELAVLKLVSERLGSAGIPYMITGSVAANFYAVPRMTRDVDMVIEVLTPDADRLVELFKADFYIDRAAVRQAIDRRGMFNIIHNDSVLKIDFIVRKDAPYRELEFKRRREIEVEGIKLWIVSPEDLTLMSDTDPEATRRMIAMFRRKTPAERLRMGCSMFDFSRQLVISSFNLTGNASPSPSVRQQLFLRFYGGDFDARKREEILAHFVDTPGPRRVFIRDGIIPAMTPIWAITPEKIQEAIRKIVDFERPRKIILFGSAARGETNINSDVDFLVVTRDEVESARKESVRIRRALRGLSMPMDILVISEERLKELGDRPGLVYREALRTGKVVYDAAA